MSSEQYCPFCGSLIKEGDVFCNNCGASMEETPEPTPVAAVQQPTDFSYTDTPQVVVPPTKPSDANTYSFISLGAGIGSVVLTIIPFIGFFAIISAIVAFVCGGLGISKETKNYFAIAGIVLGLIGIVLWILEWLGIFRIWR